MCWPVRTPHRLVGGIQSGIPFYENGRNYEQDNVFNPLTNEAILRVPAHNNYSDNAFIMVGRGRRNYWPASPLAGKMMSIEDTMCELHDIPDFINPEALNQHGNTNPVSSVQTIVKYVERSNLVEIRRGSEEYEGLTSDMKRECKGKPIYKADITVRDVRSSFQENGFFRPRSRNSTGSGSSNFDQVPQELSQASRRAIRSTTSGACPNENVLAACQDTSQPGSCYFWYDITNPNVRYHVLSTTELPENELCIKCCEVEGTPIIPCNCVQDQQTFSTAHFQLHFSCYQGSRFPNFDFTSTALNSKCNWSGVGACV